MSCHRTKHKFRNYFIKLREAIETKDILKLKEKTLKQELTIKQIENKKLRGGSSSNIKWYDNLNEEFIDIDINKQRTMFFI